MITILWSPMKSSTFTDLTNSWNCRWIGSQRLFVHCRNKNILIREELTYLEKDFFSLKGQKRMKSLKPRGAWLTYILQRQTKHLHIRGGVPPQQQGIKPSCRGRCGGRGILFSAKGDPQTNTIPSRNCLLLFQATSVHVHTIPRQSSSPGSTWIDGWVSNQSPHPEGYTQKRMWFSCPTCCVHLCELWTDIVTDVTWCHSLSQMTAHADNSPNREGR